MSIQTEGQIRLKDGRALGYAEYGDPQGKPVLHFHGTPSCRLEGSRPAIGDIAKRLHARLILPDRPGFGLSDFKPNRTFLERRETTDDPEHDVLSPGEPESSLFPMQGEGGDNGEDENGVSGGGF